ncbi:MAG: hypothetical protein AAFR66_01910, partial [Bacteroidota bacterium]
MLRLRYLSFFFLLVWLFSYQAELQAQTMSAADKQILMDLYNSTNGDAWNDTTNWGVGDPVDNNWYGITQVNDNGTLRIKVDLRNNNLDGPLPNSIG